jgi:hypothetical protein
MRIAIVPVALSLLACAGMEIPGVPTEVVDAPVEVPADEPAAPADDAPAAAPGALPPLEGIDDPRPDDCVMADPGAQPPALAAEQPQGTAPTVSKHTNALVETVVMKNGMTVRVSRGGCADFGETWHISPAPGAGPHAGIVKVLEHVVVTEASAIKQCVDAAPDPLPKEGFSAGEAYCTITKEDGVLAVTYSFAL